MPINKIWFWFDPTRRCNLACRLCYTKASHAKEDLDPRSFGRMLENIVSSTDVRPQLIHLNWRGEPLLNPHFQELSAMVRQRLNHVPVEWHTNGTLIDDALAERVIGSCSGHLIYVSIDGGTAAAHDLNRGPGTFDRAVGGLKRLLNARQRLAARSVRIGLYQLDLGCTPQEYEPEFLDLAKRVDRWVRVRPVEYSYADPETSPIGVVAPHHAVWRSGLGETDGHHGCPPEDPCFWAGHAFCVTPSGDVHVCLLSHRSDGIVGNLLTESASTIVMRAKTFRDRIATRGRSATAHCRGCLKPCGSALTIRSRWSAVSIDQISHPDASMTVP